MSNVITVTSENFESEVLNSEKPVLVDFWASWCGPCRMIGPVLEKIAAEVQTIKIGKVNVDEQQDLAGKFGVMSIPTLILFKNGQPVNKSVGAKSKAALLDFIK